ncbi:nitrilase-related carbon-nitrogen hydrolase [Arthrobacter sp. TE12232]
MVLLALMQANSAVLDITANCAAVDDAARTAAAAGAQLLLTPELFPVGYAPGRLRTDFDPATLPALREALAGIARRHNIALVYSLPAVTPAGGWHISATLVDESGDELLSYGKVHLFGPDERAAFAPAAAAPGVVEFHGLKTSLVICYDIEFPESARAAAVRGAELLLVPTALAGGFDAVPKVLVRARALENQLTVAYANHTGVEGSYDFHGGSIVAGPDGAVLAEAGPGAELLFAELGEPSNAAADPAEGAGSADRADDPEAAVAYLRDRRPDIYRSWDV